MKNNEQCLTRPPVHALAAIALGAIVLSAVCGCGAKAPEPPRLAPAPPLDNDLLALAPRNATAFVWADIEQLRQSPLWDAFSVILHDEAVSEITKGAGENDPLQTAKEMLVVYVENGDDTPAQILILLKGVDAAALLGNVEGQPAPSGGVAGFPATRTEKFIAAQISNQSIAFGDESLMRFLGERAQGRGETVRDDPVFSSLGLNAPTAARMFYQKGARTPDLTKYGAPPPAIDTELIAGFDAELRLSDTLDLDFDISLISQAAASQIAQELKNQKRRYSRNMFLVFLGVEWILQRIDIEAAASQLLVRVHMDQADLLDLQRLAERLRKIRDLAAGQAQTDGLAEPPTR